MKCVTVFLAIVLLSSAANAKVFKRCELVKLLRDTYHMPHLATWVCIAQKESNYNTAAVNKQSGDHGIFQISEKYWCNQGNRGCGHKCSDFENDNISDDVKCVLKIYKETAKFQGDGFNAWTTYSQCKGNVQKYVQGC
ncbi:unnamed protein product [Acanthoscelides obtectus]|uniref:lysozyme n=1 Tax=Acanthoscelides obtectus TaxID=200917 RepID=A0A9P0L5Q7_ACAOB|nr:unnamed protein product [Acanthoscelides obtectus]CAK1653134.1 Lysozyme C [Acanthoscelides obtectus]